MVPPRLSPLAVTLTTVLALALTVADAVASPRVATLDDLTIDEPVDGDVLVLGGNVTLGPNARVSGHVVTIRGTIEADPAAEVRGRTIAIRSLASLSLHPSSTDGAENAGLTAALRLLSAGAWLLATTLLAALLPARLRYGVWAVPRLGPKILLIGLMATVTLIAAVVAVLGLGPALGVPLVATLALVFTGGKAVGLTVLGGWLGAALLRRLTTRMLPLSLTVFAGVLVLQIARFLPLAGGLIWSAVSVAAIGTGVFSLALEPTSDALGVPLGQPSSTGKTGSNGL
jgi:hypothetical protein